jgi:DNA-binding Xre family transcriptional regulator
MSKKELAEKSNISRTSLSKLKKGANINTEILLKICIALDCHTSDILEIIK